MINNLCIRYHEDDLNPCGGHGDCIDTHNGLGKQVPKCEEIIRTGRCRYGRKGPYNKGGNEA